MRNYLSKVQERWFYSLNRMRRGRRGPGKIFCIGRNKTGTTSLESFFRSNGLRVGNQARAELLIDDWARGEFGPIVEYCRTAEVFQDVPFSLAHTYAALDQAYPDSRFVLTIRSSPEEWYNSLVRFLAQTMMSSSIPPSLADLERFSYRGVRKGWLLKTHTLVYGYPAVPLFDKGAYMAHYEAHNAAVIDYFNHRDDLLMVNLAERDAFERLCRHTGLDPALARPLPHLNKSRPR